MAKGALKKDSSFRGCLEPGSVIEAVYYYKEHREIYFLREAAVLAAGVGKNGSLASMASTLAALELVDFVYHTEGPDAEAVDLLASFLAESQAADPLFYFLAFEAKLLRMLGAMPEFGRCSACGTSIKSGYYDPRNGVSYCEKDAVPSDDYLHLGGEFIALLRKITDAPLHDISKAKISENLRKNFGLVLHWTYTYHVQGYRLPASLKLLR